MACCFVKTQLFLFLHWHPHTIDLPASHQGTLTYREKKRGEGGVMQKSGKDWSRCCCCCLKLHNQKTLLRSYLRDHHHHHLLDCYVWLSLLLLFLLLAAVLSIRARTGAACCRLLLLLLLLLTHHIAGWLLLQKSDSLTPFNVDDDYPSLTHRFVSCSLHARACECRVLTTTQANSERKGKEERDGRIKVDG